MNDLLIRFESPCGKFSLVFDDDGKVAYAYLRKDDVIVGDVWVYNRCGIPEQPEWKDRTKLPFANCKGYMKEEGNVTRSVSAADISVRWKYLGDQSKAHVYLFGVFVASVGVDEKPGHALFALRNGPLAKVLVDESASP